MVESSSMSDLFAGRSKEDIRTAIRELSSLLETEVVVIYEKPDNPQEDQIHTDPKLRLRVLVEKYFE